MKEVKNSGKNLLLFCCLAFVGLSAVLPVYAQQSDKAAAVMSKYGKIIQRADLQSGLSAWVIEGTNGGRVTMYLTPDYKTVFTGKLWDTATGRNLSDQFVIDQAPSISEIHRKNTEGYYQARAEASKEAMLRSGAAMSGKWKGELPDQLRGLETLTGVKEGNGAPADTVYIIVDPRCPYCKAAYAGTRSYAAKGYSIKWIPAVVLGDQANGEALSAAILSTPDGARKILGNKEQIKIAPTSAHKKALEYNRQYFYAAFAKSGMADQSGVPVAFFLDHRNGRPRMMTGVSQKVVLEEIFGNP